MRTISRDEIIQVWNTLCDLDEKGTEAIAKQFFKEQPALGIFMTAESEGMSGGAEQTRSYEIVITAWQAMTQAAGRRLKKITPEQIDAAQEANTKELGRMEEASEIEFMEWTRNAVEQYNQREVIGFIVEILMSGNEETPELAPESIGLDLLTVKTVVDCLDQHG